MKYKWQGNLLLRSHMYFYNVEIFYWTFYTKKRPFFQFFQVNWPKIFFFNFLDSGFVFTTAKHVPIKSLINRIENFCKAGHPNIHVRIQRRICLCNISISSCGYSIRSCGKQWATCKHKRIWCRMNYFTALFLFS